MFKYVFLAAVCEYENNVSVAWIYLAYMRVTLLPMAGYAFKVVK